MASRRYAAAADDFDHAAAVLNKNGGVQACKEAIRTQLFDCYPLKNLGSSILCKTA